MTVAQCSICTPVKRPVGFIPVRQHPRGVGKQARASIDFHIDASLIDELCAQSTDPENMRFLLTAPELPAFGSKWDVGCIHYRPKCGASWERNIQVRLKDGEKTLTSAPRAAYTAAVANRDTYLTVGQHALHLCNTEIREDIRLCCINPSHIVGS
jgi:hypothetical protein